MLSDFPSVAGNMPNAAPGAATILDYSEMRRPSINNSCNKVIVIKLDKLYYSKPKLYYDKPKLFNNNMPRLYTPGSGKCPGSPWMQVAVRPARVRRGVVDKGSGPSGHVEWPWQIRSTQ